MSCFIHENEKSVQECPSCLESFCPSCVSSFSDDYCTSCVDKKGMGKIKVKISLMLILTIAILGMAYFYVDMSAKLK